MACGAVVAFYVVAIATALLLWTMKVTNRPFYYISSESEEEDSPPSVPVVSPPTIVADAGGDGTLVRPVRLPHPLALPPPSDVRHATRPLLPAEGEDAGGKTDRRLTWDECFLFICSA